MQKVSKINNLSFIGSKEGVCFDTANEKMQDKSVNSKINPFVSKDILELSTKKPDNSLQKGNAEKINFKDVSIGLLESIPFIRRFVSIEDGKEKNDNFKTIAATLLLLANAPEDTRDLMAGINQFINPKKVASGLSHDYQVKFSFLRGTLFEFLLKGKGKYTKLISEYLYKIDKTLYDNQFWMKLITNIGYIKDEKGFLDRKDVMNVKVPTYNIKAANAFSRLLGRASLRLTLLSIFVFSSFEISNIARAFKQGNNIEEKTCNAIKQTFKSAITVTTILGMTAITGALLASKGPAGSLVGIGIGTYLGNKTSKYVNSKIN